MRRKTEPELPYKTAPAARRPRAAAFQSGPSISELLGVDREYRQRVTDKTLPVLLTPTCEPLHETWLPVLNTRRGDREYTAVFSTSPRAYRFGKTGDWVVLHSHGPEGSHTYTIVTAGSGWLRGKRIVRPRENECAAYYRAHSGSRAQRRALMQYPRLAE